MKCYVLAGRQSWYVDGSCLCKIISDGEILESPLCDYDGEFVNEFCRLSYNVEADEPVHILLGTVRSLTIGPRNIDEIEKRGVSVLRSCGIDICFEEDLASLI